MKCIAINGDGKYLTPRRNTGALYNDRAGWSAYVDDAKIFQTKAAASNSARQAGGIGVVIHRVEFCIVEAL